MSKVEASLKEAALTWMAHDPDPETVEELSNLLSQAEGVDSGATEIALEDLRSRFAAPLSFGTAGLRGAIGAGPGRMNVAVVRRATFGLCQVLREVAGAGFKVGIGFDARYGSADFARAAAGVVVAAGGKALLMPRPLPTPVLAFATKFLGLDAGIMVTASHNPAADNGYKVYLGGRIVSGVGSAAQLVSPWDGRIFEQIVAAPQADEVPCALEGWEVIPESLIEEYISRAVSLVSDFRKRDVRVVLTSMHGVGAEVCEKVLGAADFHDVHPVAAQRLPDPDFPTVPFPNPEEAGALDLAFALAREVSADVVIANDPDADRCAVAVPDVAANGGWRQLSGDELGAILGLYAARGAQKGGANAGSGSLARSLVSGSLLDKIAISHGLTPQVSLTGFKWISRSENMVFGYEEAIGYCCAPDIALDKDGITATVLIAAIAAELKAEGRTLLDVLDDLACEHGLHVTAPLTFRVENLDMIASGMKALRTGGLPSLAGAKPSFSLDLSNTDYEDGFPSSVAAGWEHLRKLPPTDALFYGVEGGSRVVVRPSGTEPKLKCYLEVVDDMAGLSPDARRAALGNARKAAAEKLDIMKAELKAALGF
ncbi:MAG: phospho-sugar mutase [Actinomycetaceae bacterium]|nr:phospho-sugar mutase [Actinomycetaceae bacterium]